MNVRAPLLPNKADLQPLAASAIAHEATIERALLVAGDLSSVQAGNVSLDECILERPLALGAQLEKLGASDVIINAGDFSAVRCSDGSFIRTRITQTRMVGTDFSRSTLKDVTFEGCKLDMANFRFSKLKNVIFKNCTFVESDFQGAQFNNVWFEDCILTKTEFANCTPKAVDLRSSQLNDVRGWQFLRGVVIDSLQLTAVAPQLAHELGITVRERTDG